MGAPRVGVAAESKPSSYPLPAMATGTRSLLNTALVALGLFSFLGLKWRSSSLSASGRGEQRTERETTLVERVRRLKDAVGLRLTQLSSGAWAPKVEWTDDQFAAYELGLHEGDVLLSANGSSLECDGIPESLESVYRALAERNSHHLQVFRNGEARAVEGQFPAEAREGCPAEAGE